jgi:hypothetical protein
MWASPSTSWASTRKKTQKNEKGIRSWNETRKIKISGSFCHKRVKHTKNI